MYPFKFKPIFKTLIWGGEKIAPYKGVQTDQHQIGESWELSGVKGSESVVSEGEYAGVALPDLVAQLKGELVGQHNFDRFGTEFPLLVKFIDARQDLSIQVHPNDALSEKRHHKKGKTEMWYVIAADQGAHLRSGLSRQMTPDEYEQSVEQGTITDYLHDYQIHAGELFFLPAGRIHSIGAGAFIAEIQQTSDVTYRIFDFNRVGADGKCRELHTQLAKDAIDYTVLPDYRSHYQMEKNRAVMLASCPYFTTQLYDVDQPLTIDLSTQDSFLLLVCIEGSGAIVNGENQRVTIRQGETVLVPASERNITIEPDQQIKLITSCCL
ncbi:MAG: type I phosphomannose isomerase catalytic subunit [Alistipes sp.]